VRLGHRGPQLLRHEARAGESGEFNPTKVLCASSPAADERCASGEAGDCAVEEPLQPEAATDVARAIELLAACRVNSSKGLQFLGPLREDTHG
jgi:hypothetical protein